MFYAFLCPESTGMALFFVLAAMAVVALPLAVGAAFISALVKLVSELFGVRRL
ncbi:MAG: hypothetical protein WKF84_11030 [Pyrinomonadaceae bacterium]